MQRVVVRQYGDEPTIEPGELLVRLVLEPPDDRRPDGTDADALVIEEFHRSQGAAIRASATTCRPCLRWRWSSS